MPRTLIDAAQTAALERAFVADMFPCRATRWALAEELGLTPRNVQMWFENRRQRRDYDVLRMFVACCADVHPDNEESVSSIAVLLGVAPECVRTRLVTLVPRD